MARYFVAVQCDIVKQRCSGYQCELAFHNRADSFAAYGQEVRFLSMSCDGCCGRAVHRKLGNLLRQGGKREGLKPEDVVVHLSSCVCKESYHGPVCPHLEYLESLIADKLGLAVVHGTVINDKAESRRQSDQYQA